MEYLTALRSELLEDVRKDKSALRYLYVNNYDGVIYNIIANFFNAASSIYSTAFYSKTALTKTIGIQGLFDVLKAYVLSFKDVNMEDVDFTEEMFESIFHASKYVNFADDIFLKFSGVGRARVRDAILLAADYKRIDEIKNEDFTTWLKTNLS